jgi:hypothetical protein
LLCLAACSLTHAAAAQTNGISSSATNTVGLWANGTEYLHIGSTGFVGIGTLAPNTTLQVNGSIMVGTGTCGSSTAGSIQWNGSALQYCNGSSWTTLAAGIGGSGTTNYLARWTPNGTTLGIGATYDNGTNVGIGTAAPQSTLQVQSGQILAPAGAPATPSYATINSTNEGLYFPNASAVGLAVSGETVFDIQTTKLGLFNDTSPNFSIGMPGTSAESIGVERNTGGAGNSLSIQAGGGANANLNANGGTLVLSSGISTGTGTSGINFNIYQAGSSGGNSNSATTAMTILGTGNVGIGTTGPAYLLHVGSASAQGTVAEFQNSSGNCTFTPTTSTWSCSSDARLKKDIVDTGVALPWISDMRIRDFTLKATGEHKTGVIAQEMLTTHPDMVHLGKDSFYTVDDPNPWKLVKAIQELRLDIINLRAKNADDAHEIAALRREFEAYRAAHP